MPLKTPRRFSIVRPRQGIVIDLDELRQLMREFIDEAVGEAEDLPAYEWRFERFLQWLRLKRQETSDVNSHANRPRN